MHARTLRRTTSGVLSVLLSSVGCATLAGAAQAAPGSVSTTTVAATTPTPLTLDNGWVSEDSTYGTGEPAVSLSPSGIVALSGSLANGTAGSEAFFLPAGDRPSKNLYMTDYTLDGTNGYLLVTPSGAVYPEGSQATGYTSLAAISFPSAGTGLGFSDLGLINSWVSEDSVYGTGDPAVAIEPSGIVHLSGSLAGGQSSTTAFVLPAQDRPAHTDYIDMYTVSGTTGVLVVGTNGSVGVYGNDASQYTSLAGVSFPASHTTLAFKKLALHDKWKGGAFATGTPSAAKDSAGIVHLEGGLSAGKLDSEAFTLPAADRPSHTLYITTDTFSGVVGTLVIEASGAAYPRGTSVSSTTDTATEFTSLASISFPSGV